MKSVLRIALTYFTFAPLQSWLSVIGLSVVAASLLVRLVAGAGPGAMVPAIFGAALVCMGPVFGGGVILRHGSSRHTMMLRPLARLRMLLGTTLAMNVVVLLAVLPFLLDKPAGLQGNPAPSAADVFAVAWAVLALDWIAVFALSAYRFGPALLWIIPVAAVSLLRGASPQQMPPPSVALAAGVALWMAFSAWYLRRRSHGPSLATGIGSPALNDPGLWSLLFPSTTAPAPRSAREARRRWLFGDASPTNHALISAGSTLLVVVLLYWMLDRPPAREKSLTGGILYIGLLISSFTAGYWLVGRSRALWLRTGLDRAGLLRHTELSGLLPMVISALASVFIIVLTQFWLRPDLLVSIILNAFAQMALAACLAYAGLSFTTSWSVQTVIAFIGSWVLGMTGLLFLGAGHSPRYLIVAITLLAGLALLLRTNARRRWRSLDWRVKRPQMNPPAGMRARA